MDIEKFRSCSFFDFLGLEIPRNEIVCQANLARSSDYMFDLSKIRFDNRKHFGLRGSENYGQSIPRSDSVVFARFKSNEHYEFAERIKGLSAQYTLLQYMIGDSGELTDSFLSAMPANITRVFTKNYSGEDSRVKAIPVGRDWRNIDLAREIVSIETISSWSQRKHAYLNISTNTHDLRKKIYERFKFESWVESRPATKHGVYYLKHVDYLRELATCKFVFAPRGYTKDSYRAWDSLYMKSIPLIDRNSHTESVYDKLPVAFVSDWEDVNVLWLERKMQEILCSEFDLRKLFASYWNNIIRPSFP